MPELTAPGRRQQLREMIYRETGIKMPETKDNLLVSRLRRRFLEGGFRTFDDYLGHLFDSGALRDEWDLIIDQVTTNKTDFFREPRHFDILLRQAVPEALGRARPGATARFRLWSAAASTGAEAYTAAMVLADAALRDARLDWAILGTDISKNVLTQAERAIYPTEQLHPVPADLRTRYVMTGRGPTGVGQSRIVPELRRRTRFAELNLTDPPFPVAQNVDVIFLRNVLIYFDTDRQARVVSEVTNHLRPGGWLFVGHAESMIVEDPRLSQVAPAVFRKMEANA
ncbi:CheR family methyltransferase [Marinibacterium profundimaris]|uniref:Chemotaxis protein methyltransferase n=1 Tax=Marinibacterium profundimaris TaxID=1679460 RepID=A0A225NMS7_9RHOB|nr:CheR family methyltransferase [Marinibacterium profundimaris]OWU73469.1 chemotaxis protein CheR [Marinibacterium profundimaris]